MTIQPDWKAFVDAFGFSVFDLSPSDRQAFRPRAQAVIDNVEDELRSVREEIEKILHAANDPEDEQETQELSSSLFELRKSEGALQSRLVAFGLIAEDVFSAKE